MYLAALERLDAAGFAQYEISNVARPGFPSRHNVKYWQAGSWRGFGCGAHSTVDGVRWKNVTSTTDYIDRIGRGASVVLDRQELSPAERLRRRCSRDCGSPTGIDRRNFLARYGVDPWTRYAETLAPFVDEGLMWADDERFGLTRRGMLVANDLLVTFV